MIPKVLDQYLISIGECDDYLSFIWTNRYYSPGDFEITVPVNKKNLELFIIGNYVRQENDSKCYGVIENLVMKESESGEEQMVVSGRFLSSILDRRVVWIQTTFVNNTLTQALNKLFNENIINPANPERKISNFEISSNSYTPAGHFTAQYTGNTLLEIIEEWALAREIGFIVTIETGKLVFSFYKGVDSQLILSMDNELLLSAEYEIDYQNLKTDILVAGEGEGYGRTTAWSAGSGKTGLDRREAFKNATIKSSKNNGSTMSESNYRKVLAQEGDESLVPFSSVFTGQYNFDKLLYRKDINVGDTCTLVNRKWGVSVEARLVEMIESMDSQGKYSLTATFGS